MLFSMGLTVVSAEDSAEEEYKKAEWEMNEEAFYLTLNGTKNYVSIDIPFRFHFDQMFSFEFADTVEFNDKTYKIEGNSHDPSIIVVTHKGWGYFFADERGEEIIEDYIAGKNSVYFLEDSDGGRYARIDESFKKTLDDYLRYATADTIEAIDVSTIQPENEIYYITAHDRTESLTHQHGAIYRNKFGVYYYLTLDDLPNDYFDSSGDLSFRKGVVAMTRLSDDIANMVRISGIDNMKAKDRVNVMEARVIRGWTDVYGNELPSEDDYVDDPDTSVLSGLILSFWLSFSLWGFVFPIGIILLGLLLPASKKRKNEKYWRILAMIGGIWLLTSLSVIAVVLI